MNGMRIGTLAVLALCGALVGCGSAGDATDSAPARTPESLVTDARQLDLDGEQDAAIALYRQALRADETLSIAWNGLSMALARKGDLEAAVEAAEKLIELEPDDPLSHTNLSRILMQKGLIPEAEDARARAMALQMGGGSTS
jgi:tetratricopeptide (TPR) repeat protein